MKNCTGSQGEGGRDSTPCLGSTAKLPIVTVMWCVGHFGDYAGCVLQYSA